MTEVAAAAPMLSHMALRMRQEALAASKAVQVLPSRGDGVSAWTDMHV
jgi:hypothetical protein